ncbi:hypothetical protein [Marivirga sp.]|uniref:hypothetical protein n=1 Tax=Marivirga sp. TaxID=2018662 RepID=UPI003DA6EAD2
MNQSEIIKNNIPLISGGLIFLGYLNYHFYYSQFDININTYLTTSELIFSFLPLTVPFILTLSASIVIFIGLQLSIVHQEKDSQSNKEEEPFNELLSVKSSWHKLKFQFNKKKDIFDYIFLPINTIVFLISIAIQLFLIVFIMLVAGSFSVDHQYIGFGGLLILGILWLILIFARITIYKKEQTRSKIKFMSILFLLNLIILFLWLNNKEKANKILNNKKILDITILMDKDTIKSDSNLLYIGKTSEYIFFRDVSDSSNKIYKLDELLELKQK